MKYSVQLGKTKHEVCTLVIDDATSAADAEQKAIVQSKYAVWTLANVHTTATKTEEVKDGE